MVITRLNDDIMAFSAETHVGLNSKVTGALSHQYDLEALVCLGFGLLVDGVSQYGKGLCTSPSTQP